MNSLNSVIVEGNLTRDPEFKKVGANATTLANLSVAVNKSRKVGDEWEQEVSYFDVDAWGKTAENLEARGVQKGWKVRVTGSLKQERWQTDDGNRSKVKIVASYVETQKPKDAGSDSTQSDGDFSDDVPF